MGDRIEFRAPDRQQKIGNGALAHITHLDLANGQAVAKLDNGRRRWRSTCDHGWTIEH